jgi:hypothetical protein
MKSILLSILLLAVFATACNTSNQQPPEQSALVTAANETAAMARLRAIVSAERLYQVDSGGQYATLDQLIQKRFVNDPSGGKLTGYRFDVQVRAGGFQLTAVPEKYGITGKRSFYTDETDVVRAADKKGSAASASDPEV